tara:strand:+ start:932 stop:1363 length:432 start_codon:yes stop_codon:yes gene_type:complete
VPKGKGLDMTEDMNTPEFDEHEQYGQEIIKAIMEQREFANDNRLPHLEVEVKHDQDWFTPLRQTATAIEGLMNILLTKYAMTRNDDYLSMIGFFTQTIQNFEMMVAEIAMREDGKDPHEEYEKSQIADIPNAFLDAFKKDDKK